MTETLHCSGKNNTNKNAVRRVLLARERTHWCRMYPLMWCRHLLSFTSLQARYLTHTVVYLRHKESSARANTGKKPH